MIHAFGKKQAIQGWVEINLIDPFVLPINTPSILTCVDRSTSLVKFIETYMPIGRRGKEGFFFFKPHCTYFLAYIFHWTHHGHLSRSKERENMCCWPQALGLILWFPTDYSASPLLMHSSFFGLFLFPLNKYSQCADNHSCPHSLGLHFYWLEHQNCSF